MCREGARGFAFAGFMCRAHAEKVIKVANGQVIYHPPLHLTGLLHGTSGFSQSLCWPVGCRTSNMPDRLRGSSGIVKGLWDVSRASRKGESQILACMGRLWAAGP